MTAISRLSLLVLVALTACTSDADVDESAARRDASASTTLTSITLTSTSGAARPTTPIPDESPVVVGVGEWADTGAVNASVGHFVAVDVIVDGYWFEPCLDTNHPAAPGMTYLFVDARLRNDPAAADTGFNGLLVWGANYRGADAEVGELVSACDDLALGRPDELQDVRSSVDCEPNGTPLEPGQTVCSTLVFEIPGDASGLSLRYTGGLRDAVIELGE